MSDFVCYVQSRSTLPQHFGLYYGPTATFIQSGACCSNGSPTWPKTRM
jgi:hypothetical protein